jgi:mxaC protein
VPFDLEHPAILALLPLALLPLLRRGGEALTFSSLALLPDDRPGRWWELLWRTLAMYAMACILVGLSGPGIPGARVERTGHGAEILILFDRSSSMDSIIVPQGVMGAGRPADGETKNGAARKLLTQFVMQRPGDRFALMTFGTSVMPVAPFTDHNQAVLAGLAATGVGRGLPNTHMGAALLAAIDEFRSRAYSGSRIIVLVSDGGATLDQATRQRIQAGLARQRVGLYFIYIRNNGNSPNLLQGVDDGSAADEVALHRFFVSLPTPYHLYQAEDSRAIAGALADISGRQNLPLTFFERVQRRDFTALLFGAAALACGALWIVELLLIRKWS